MAHINDDFNYLSFGLPQYEWMQGFGSPKYTQQIEYYIFYPENVNFKIIESCELNLN